MKTLLFAVFVAFVVGSYSYDLSLPNAVLFNQFITREQITFASTGEAHAKFVVFSDNVERIRQLNAAQTKATFGINKFALMTVEEFAQTHHNLPKPEKSASDPVAKDYPQEIVKQNPTSWDWTAKGAVTGVKDQGQCGSCWTFSTTGNIEGQWFLAGNELVSLSEQNIVDCDHLCANGSCDAGCSGGLMGTAFEYVMQKGVDTESSYPYTAEDGTKCLFNPANVGATINGWTMISSDETQMAANLYQRGPLSVAVDANSWQFYVGGVLYNPIPCGTALDHGVLIVGYGTETNIIGETMPFWKIKNSWGAGWGESGYIRIERGVGYCGVNLYCCSSIVNKK